MRGVDVSIHNDPVNWQRLKDAGIEFAIKILNYLQFGLIFGQFLLFLFH